ncbi:lamin tail domain-containing protein [Winogradskyella tangerina]|uniref:lamin tail domain-containing protein n=1 Tax=Winogradskyella tangerina TaxID=2023240 RepID=UPI000DBE3B6A|nr:lamin tail domain-containing protein [Winogradskyella tangerina]
MKKNYLSLLLILFVSFKTFGQSDVIISQYIETNSGTTPKGIEIFNVSGAAITFTPTNNLEVFQGTNGGACTGTALVDITSGTLGIDEVWVIGTSDLTSDAITNGTDLSGTTDYNFSFNGDDALRVTLGGVVQDMFGECGTDPGSAWSGSGVATNNNNLQIKNGICDGDIDGWTDPSVRFDQIANGSDMTGFGNAPASCSSSNTSVEFVSTSSTLAENGTFIDICVGITNPSATNATTVEISLDGSSSATNGTDYDDGAGVAISFPVTLTFPAGSSANQCLTIHAENDAIIEGDENLVLDLTNANGGDTAALGTDVQHILTIDDDDDTFPADVVITEIMYNTQGTDDEWIEICNISGTAQVLNGYSIEVDNIVEYTFPSSGVIIADGDCITVALGTDGDGTFNDGIDTSSSGYCPFVPDYGISLTPANSGQLPNSTALIEIVASDGTSVVDNVTYDNSDGADGNGESLHVIDASQDNSDTGTNWQEVLNGGSYTGNTLISPCTPAGPEINLEGTTSGFPDITDGDTTPSTLDGTNFGGVVIGGTSTNTFRIENFAGTTDLTITSVTVSSGDTGDFSITLLPSSPIAALGSSNFDVEFSPTAVGTRTAVIEIVNNDSDENPYTFIVTGNGLCAASTITALPNSGPVGTIVTVTGTNLSTATASFNGVAATVNNISATEMEVIVPAGASSGNLEITDDLGCPGTTPFTVIESQISSCEGSGGTTPTDLFISEVTDANTGGLTYVEIYNGTGATVNLSSYSIQFFNNGNATENGGSITLANVNLASDDTYILAVSQGASCTGVTGGDGSLADQTGSGGINFVANGDDHIRLYDGSTHVDSWGEYLSDTWADALGIGSEGVVFTRDNDAANLPSTTFNLADWTYVDWASCADNDYSNIGTYDFSTGTPPTVNSISDQSTACNETTITVSATEGASGGNTLNYVWYLYNPAQSASGWQVISNGGIYTTSATSPNLVISDAASVSDFQFYCEVREDDASCYSASDAIQITVSTATWDGTNWTWNDSTAMNTVPTTSANVIINGDYDTANGGAEISFEACECLVNSGTLTIDDNTYVLVENDLTVDGNIVVKKDGAFVQVNDAAIVDGDVLTDKTKISVEKETAPLASQLEYTYWSSPVVGEVISDGLFEANPNRIYYFNGQNFRDSTEETNNDNTTATGQDDIDDDGNDWQFAVGSTVMSPGVGYAATHSPTGFVPSRYLYTFEGAFNNGVINVPIYRDDAELLDNNWNFIGNPYPSAIDADLFLAANASIDQTVGATNGAIFFWSHNTAANGNTNGNEELNYSQSDYAIINGSGETAGGDNVIPTRHIPSGQGFFVSMDNAATSTSAGGTIQTTDVVFNNSMRLIGNNSQFFRNANPFNKLWLNLTSDNGVFNQTLIAYVDGASDEDDGMYYDARKNQSSDLYSGIYTTLDASTDDKFAIQGKHPNSLDMDEVIQLGFNTVIDEATIYTIAIHNVEGQFMTDNDIFIIDYELNTIHNLKQSDYSFTSEVGEFNDRFDIVFRANALSIDDNTISSNDLSITELSNGDVRIKVNEALTIEAVEILDLLGRRIYSLKGSSASEVYDLSKLSNAAYIAKVTLSNGQIISKKAIKQQ